LATSGDRDMAIDTSCGAPVPRRPYLGATVDDPRLAGAPERDVFPGRCDSS
jgi:hypothetical protein